LRHYYACDALLLLMLVLGRRTVGLILSEDVGTQTGFIVVCCGRPQYKLSSPQDAIQTFIAQHDG
jgi:hypothetical protein